MIEKATIADLPELSEMLLEFRDSSEFLEGDPAIFVQSWTAILNAGLGVILIQRENDKIIGAISGVAHPDPNTGRRNATEFFWFVSKEHRHGGAGIRLYKAFEHWATENCCVQIQMGHLCDVMPETVAGMYQRLGYKQAEVRFTKPLEVQSS